MRTTVFCYHCRERFDIGSRSDGRAFDGCHAVSGGDAWSGVLAQPSCAIYDITDKWDYLDEAVRTGAAKHDTDRYGSGIIFICTKCTDLSMYSDVCVGDVDRWSAATVPT